MKPKVLLIMLVILAVFPCWGQSAGSYETYGGIPLEKITVTKSYRDAITSDTLAYRLMAFHYYDQLQANLYESEKQRRTDNGQPLMNTDITVTFSGANDTANFINSPGRVTSFLTALFTDIHCSGKTPEEIKTLYPEIDYDVDFNVRKISGINLYFQDFDFSDKRAMAQFIKSVSLIIDNCPVEELRELQFYATFDKTSVKGHLNYLCGLAQMTDSIFLFTPAEGDLLPDLTVLDSSHTRDQGFLKKLKSQFYMATFYTKPFPDMASDKITRENIVMLVDADYEYNNWEVYMFILIGVVLLIIVAVILYYTMPAVSSYIDKNVNYVYLLMVIALIEIILLLGVMFESMSMQDALTRSNGSRNLILLLPLLLVLIIPVIKAVNKRRLHKRDN